ncbi:MAG: SDR family oxidoreductase [Proteobacteria bacterium]|nr:SDR family oxidoreductase [Pseudomonadota bacterium]MCH8188283.1 SDR family oxidoreductase [Pseudomonadota bacterium]
MAQVILVTGGSRGIGAATARLLGRGGHAVGVNYVNDEGKAQEVVGAVEAAGGRAAAVRADVSDEDAVRAMFDTVEQTLGPLDGLVNSAGIVGDKCEVAGIDVAMLRRVFEINVIGAFLCSREAVRRMALSKGGRGGAIVNLSSVAAKLGGPGAAVHYAASKGAIDSFTVGLGREVAKDGIRVNAVRPGLIDTDMNHQPSDPDRLERLGPTVPMGRVGQPEEVAEAIVWLLSEAASYVAGDVVTISGGR